MVTTDLATGAALATDFLITISLASAAGATGVALVAGLVIALAGATTGFSVFFPIITTFYFIDNEPSTQRTVRGFYSHECGRTEEKRLFLGFIRRLRKFLG